MQWAISNGYTFTNTGRQGNSGGDGVPPDARKYEPVTSMSWRDVIVWCNAYSDKVRLKPAYLYQSRIIKNSFDATTCDNAVCDWSADGYRLTTEGEWQYAASYIDGATWTPYNYASGSTSDYKNEIITGDFAWYSANSGNKTQAVGTKTPNQLGIYDMSGNVWEWCWDWRAEWPTTAQTNYRGPFSGSHKIGRGGSWYSRANAQQIGCNSFNPPDHRISYIGFRLVRR